jgi:hypothetical protein
MAKRPQKQVKQVKQVKQQVKLRTESKPIPKQESRKRPEPEPEPPKPKKTKIQIEYKFVRVATDAPQEEFKAVGDRVQAGELKWHHYASDGNKGFHHYLVLSNTK